MYCSPFSLIAYFTKFICVCYRINLTGGQWKKAVKRKSINQGSGVAAGIVVHFCPWIIVELVWAWQLRNLQVCRGQSQVVSDDGYKSHYVAGLRWLWSLPVTVLPVVFTYEEGHIYFTLAWNKIVCDKKSVWQKMPWVVWLTWIMGKCGLNLVNNDLFWKVKVFSLKLFETKGYSLFNLETTC